MKRFLTYLHWCCMTVCVMLLVSCERETWGIDRDYNPEPGEPINVLIPFEVPSSDNVAITRGMSEIEEHNIKNLYILVFTASDKKLYYRQYYDSNRLNEGKVNYSNSKEWGSVIDDNKETNSTYGTVMARALSERCFIYGIANVTFEAGGVDGESTDDLKGILDGLVTKEQDPENAATIDDLYNLVATLKYDNTEILNRDNSNLLLSGVFEMKDRYKTKVGNADKYNAYRSKYVKGNAGEVDFQYIIDNFKDEDVVDAKGEDPVNYYVDLSKAGVVKLRRLSSHITFKITINEDVFSDFKPESWQVFHVPVKSYIMDQGDSAHHVESNTYENSTEVYSMLHAEGSYQFDFYMYENFKNARDISEQSGTDWNYYKNNYGNTLEATKTVDESPVTLPKLAAPDGIYYKNAAVEVWQEKKKTEPTLTLEQAKTTYADLITQLAKDNFTYAKRELALKEGTNGTYVKNADKSKNFVYVEPNATYVVIKGRLRFNPTDFKLTDLLTGESTTQENVSDSYADVTYTVHLGYAREGNLEGKTPVNPGSGASAEQLQAYEDAKATYKLKDFNSLRNTQYTYNIRIDGINSIYTQVETESADDVDKRETAQLQPGAAGFIGKASGKVYDLDAHYNSFIVFFSKKQLGTGGNGFHFEIKTPWDNGFFITLDDCLKEVDGKKVLDDAAYTNWLKDNPDFNWIKFRRNYDQTKGTNEDYINYNGTSHREAMPYYKASGDEHRTDCPLIDLYQLLKELEKLSDTGLPIKIGSSEYTAHIDTSGNLYYDNSTEQVPLDGLFYTVFLDEYYYQTPPLKKDGSPRWSTTSGHEPYWHFFVNKPARYVSFGTSGSFYTRDGESSKIEPELMIVQHSIQTHYATAAGVLVGLGMEHYNDTPHPRWKDTGGGGNVETSGHNRKYGWINTKNAIVKDAVLWDNYVAKYVGLYNNLTMVPSSANLPTPKTGQDGGDLESDAQYKANAIRLCMNRNRDENGNGKIDVEEMKWYLPASEQIDIINMCHFSFSDPLLNYNDYIYGTDDNGNIRYRLKKRDGSYPTEFRGRNYYQFHYVTSDYMKLIGEEMMNLNTYNQVGDWTTRPGEMRCVRNLGTGKDTDGNALSQTSVNKPYYSYTDGVASGGLSATAELQDNPASVPGDIFKFEPKLVDGKWTKKWFIMDSHLDSRSIRTAKYENEELPPHYLFSETNRPYKAFQVAQNAKTMTMSVYGNNIGGTRFIELEDIYKEGSRLCGSYTEDAGGSDLGSWRAPNAAELSLMAHYLRVNNSEGKAIDNYSPNLFFGGNTDPQPYSTTSWNWAGDYWIRVVGIKSDGTYYRKLYLSDPYEVTETGASISVGQNYNYGQANTALRDGVSGILLRCVKDIEPPIEN